jgi:hypothetical protein
MLPCMSLIMISFTVNQCNAFISSQVNICWRKTLNVSPKIVLSFWAVSHGKDYTCIFTFSLQSICMCRYNTQSLMAAILYLHFPYKAYACVIITHSLSWQPFYVYIFPTKHVLFVISHILLGSSHCCIKLKSSHCNYENPPNAPKGEEQGRGIITQGCHRCS